MHLQQLATGGDLDGVTHDRDLNLAAAAPTSVRPPVRPSPSTAGESTFVAAAGNDGADVKHFPAAWRDPDAIRELAMTHASNSLRHATGFGVAAVILVATIPMRRPI